MYKKLIYLIPFVLVLGLAGVANGTEGLLGQYYLSSGEGPPVDPWQTLVMERIDPTIDFYLGYGSLDPSIRSDDFAVRWTGEIKVPSSGTYTFHTQSDEGIRLWVNNQLIIDNWTNHGNTHDSGNITLTAGQQYDIKLEWYEDGDNAVCELSWSTATITRETIPSRYLSVVGRPYPHNPNPADGAIIRATWVSMSWTPGAYAASHDVYLGENFDDVDAGTADTFQGNQDSAAFAVGFPGFPYPDGVVPGTTYYWRIVDVEADGTTTHKGPVWSFKIAPKTAFNPNPPDGAEFVDPNVALSWKPGFGAIMHYVYFGDDFDVVNDATGGLPWGAATYTPGTLELEKTYYWRVDAFHGVETYKGDVWGFTTPGAVGSLMPSNGAQDVRQTLILRWSPGDSAASHQVYFGTDKDAVQSANTGSPEYKGSRDLGSESYDPGQLEWDSTYYWRVDGIDNANPDSPWVGLVWSFTTANFLIVDDFELYNDLDPADPESNRIFNTWIDGYGIPTNGSIVGYENPPFAEQTIVHSGNQSMPFSYDNSVGYSEAEMTLTSPRDWTEKGVNKLTIWFRGNSANAAETLYVALNGSAVVSHGNPNAAQITTWTEWNIDLQVFADQGVNLANVNTIALGLGNKKNPQAGGSGTMYIDDIRLYPPPPEPAP
ncbi:MAG: PA14 domain-containing protein [Phycisphaerae bacterium]